VAATAAVSAFGLSASAPSACAVDFNVNCRDIDPAYFSHAKHPNPRTITVTNTGSCDLLVRSRETGESQPSRFTLKAPPAGGSRAGQFTGKFVEFAVLCTHGANPCKGSVTG
jgi:hypothetical protein